MDFFCIKSNKLEMQINFAHILSLQKHHKVIASFTGYTFIIQIALDQFLDASNFVSFCLFIWLSLN